MPARGTSSRRTTRRSKNVLKTVKITKTVPVRPMKDTTKAQVLTLARRLLSKEAENKSVGWNTEDCISHNGGIGAADCYPIVEDIVSGTLANQRLGDRIKPKSLTVRGVVGFNPATLLTNQDIYVRVVILAQKNIKVGSAVTGGVDASRLLHPSIAGTPSQGFTGRTMELNYPVNKELFRVYMDKTFKLTSSGGPGGASVDPNAGYSKRWSYRFKQLPAALTFDEGNGDWANNFAPFVAIGYAFSDCTAPDIATTRIKSNTFSLLEFEDA